VSPFPDECGSVLRGWAGERQTKEAGRGSSPLIVADHNAKVRPCDIAATR